MANYLSDLKSRLTPEQYQALTKPLMYTANEKYGGNVQDYQAQLLMPIDVKSLNIKKKIDATPATTATREGGDGNITYEVPAQLNEAGYHPIYTRVGESAADVVDGYTSDTPEIVNGVPVYGNYNLNGELMYYTGDKGTNTWINGKNFITGYWDPSGKPAPSVSSSGGGGFFSDVLDNPIVSLGAQYFGGPLGVAALTMAKGGSLEDAAKSAATSYAVQEGTNYLSGTTDPNAVGGVTGPDNIDVGGGWSPAAGATSGALTTEFTGDNIDAGGGWSPATGATEAELASARAALAATPTEVAAAKAAGMTVSDYLNYARAGLLVNALTGDPLGLGGGGGGGNAPTGFAQVPIPAEWKSPTYAASSAPIDLSTIFSNQNMLGGTQWQGLPSQQNMSFNDIFSSGQQQTPMGTPVDINQIVSSILGQTATS